MRYARALPSFASGGWAPPGQGAHPDLARGLVLAFAPFLGATHRLPSLQGVLFGKVINGISSAPGNRVAAGENGIVFRLLTSAGTLTVKNSDLWLPTKKTTVLFGYRKTDATLRTHNVISTNTSTVARWFNIQLPHTDGKVYWQFGGNTEGTSRLSFTPDASHNYQREHVYATTAGARGLEAFIDGVLVAKNSGTPTRSAFVGSFHLGNGFNNADLAEFSFLYIWDHQKSASEIAAISADPGMLLRSRRHFISFAPVAAGLIELPGISSPVSVGSLALSTINLPGISSPASVGALAVSTINLPGISSPASVGDITVTAPIIEMPGISSPVSVGSPSFAALATEGTTPHWLNSLVPTLNNNGASPVTAVNCNSIIDWDEVPGTTVRVRVMGVVTQNSTQAPLLKVMTMTPDPETPDVTTEFALANVTGPFQHDGVRFPKPSGVKRTRCTLELAGAGTEFRIASLLVVMEVT